MREKMHIEVTTEQGRLNNLDDVIVSIKDIEECTKSLSQIVATAINNCIYK